MLRMRGAARFHPFPASKSSRSRRTQYLIERTRRLRGKMLYDKDGQVALGTQVSQEYLQCTNTSRRGAYDQK